MDKKLFTIVMPVLNAGVFLERALDSVLAQAADDTEVIVVDGGSRDGSVEVIVHYAKRLAWWCTEPDAGQSAALNKGFARAQGEYLLWVNGDDLLLPGALERARHYLQRAAGCRWLAGNLIYIDADDRVVRCARDGAWRDWLYREAPVRVYGPSAIFSRELLVSVGGLDESLHYLMDTDLWLRFRAAGVKFCRLPYYCWAFRVHEKSKTSGDLRGQQSAVIGEERRRVYAKNGLQVTARGLWQQRLWRLLNGCYVRALADTARMRGSKVADTKLRAAQLGDC